MNHRLSSRTAIANVPRSLVADPLEDAAAQSYEDAADFINPRFNARVIGRGDDPQIVRQQRVIIELTRGCERDLQKVSQLTIRIATTPFGDVGGYRQCRAPHLMKYDTVRTRSNAIGQVEDVERQSMRATPRSQPSEWIHAASSAASDAFASSGHCRADHPNACLTPPTTHLSPRGVNVR